MSMNNFWTDVPIFKLYIFVGKDSYFIDKFVELGLMAQSPSLDILRQVKN